MSLTNEVTKDYVIHAFSLYASLGEPTDEEAEALLIKHRTKSAKKKQGQIITTISGRQYRYITAALQDIAAVNGTIKLLSTGRKEPIIEAVKYVYFVKPEQSLTIKEVKKRVKSFAAQYNVEEKEIYLWLRQARELCASLRGLNLDFTDDLTPKI